MLVNGLSPLPPVVEHLCHVAVPVMPQYTLRWTFFPHAGGWFILRYARRFTSCSTPPIITVLRERWFFQMVGFHVLPVPTNHAN
jgi:hypothetical protein